MGTRVKDLMEAMGMHLSEKEEMEKEISSHLAFEKMHEEKKKSVTIRLDSWQMKNLDLMVEKMDSSRSALVCDLAVAALFDTIEDMGLTEIFLKRITEGFESEIEKKEADNV